MSKIRGKHQEHPLEISLFDGCQKYVQGKLADMILPANVAVEARTNMLVQRELENAAGKSRVEDFLKNGCSYSHQLNVIIPLLAKHYNFPQMSDQLRGSLNQLRALRNQIAHNGQGCKIDQQTAAELLCAALFGYRYIEIMDSSVKR